MESSNKKPIPVYFDKDDFEKVKSACSIGSWSISSFCRASTLIHAKKILSEQGKLSDSQKLEVEDMKKQQEEYF